VFTLEQIWNSFKICYYAMLTNCHKLSIGCRIEERGLGKTDKNKFPRGNEYTLDLPMLLTGGVWCVSL